MTLSATELFMFDPAVLRQPQTRLDEIASVLQSHPEIDDVRITGYAERPGETSGMLSIERRYISTMLPSVR